MLCESLRRIVIQLVECQLSTIGFSVKRCGDLQAPLSSLKNQPKASHVNRLPELGNSAIQTWQCNRYPLVEAVLATGYSE